MVRPETSGGSRGISVGRATNLSLPRHGAGVSLASSDEEFNHCLELVEFEWLLKHAIHPLGARVVLIEGALAGHQNYRWRWANVILQCRDYAHAIAIRQVEVQEDEVER